MDGPPATPILVIWWKKLRAKERKFIKILRSIFILKKYNYLLILRVSCSKKKIWRILPAFDGVKY